MRILVASKNSLAYEPLLALISTENLDLKAEAARSLGALDDPCALQTLLGLLADVTPGVRSAAALELGSLGSIDAVEPLIQALADPEWEVRIAAATALGMLGDVRAIQPLEEALAKAEYTNQKDAITDALEKLKGQLFQGNGGGANTHRKPINSSRQSGDETLRAATRSVPS
jgi:HEAT repeat protein